MLTWRSVQNKITWSPSLPDPTRSGVLRMESRGRTGEFLGARNDPPSSPLQEEPKVPRVKSLAAMDDSSPRGFLRSSAGCASAAAFGTRSRQHSAHAARAPWIRIGMMGGDRIRSGAAASNGRPGKDWRSIALCAMCEDRAQDSRKSLAAQVPDHLAVDDQGFAGFDGQRHVKGTCHVLPIPCASKSHPLCAKSQFAWEADLGREAARKKGAGRMVLRAGARDGRLRHAAPTIPKANGSDPLPPPEITQRT